MCAIACRHMKLRYALMLAKKGQETLWGVWRVVLSPQRALRGVESCMSGLLAPLCGASALIPHRAAQFKALTLLKIQLAM